MAARILAGVAAIALVVGAFAIRSGSDGSTTPGADPRTGGITLVCDPLFAEACRAVDATVVEERSGTTADRLLAGGSLDADAWVTSTGWTALVVGEQERLGAPASIEGAAIVGRSRVAIAIWADRADDVTALGCEITWQCLGEFAGSALADGGRLQSGMPPVDTAAGLTVAAAQGRSIVGLDDYAVNDFDAARRAAATALAAGQQTEPLRRMRTRGPGELTAAGVVLAAAPNLSSNFGAIDVIADDVTLDVTIATVVGGRSIGSDARNSLATQLAEEGWLDAAEPSLPSTDGLPPGSVLAAVRTIWSS